MGSVTDRWASEPDRQGQGRRYVAVWRDERRRQRKRSFHRKGDAVRFLRETERSLDLGLFAEPRAAEVGFAEYATNWLSRAEHLRAKTVADYDSILRNHLSLVSSSAQCIKRLICSKRVCPMVWNRSLNPKMLVSCRK